MRDGAAERVAQQVIGAVRLDGSDLLYVAGSEFVERGEHGVGIAERWGLQSVYRAVGIEVLHESGETPSQSDCRVYAEQRCVGSGGAQREQDGERVTGVVFIEAAQPGVDAVCERCRGRIGEDPLDRHCHTGRVRQPGHKSGGGQRVAAEGEEAIVDADSFDVEGFGEGIADGRLERGGGRPEPGLSPVRRR